MRFRVLAACFMLASGALTAQNITRVLWKEPGPISGLDFAGPVSTGVPPPKPPFKFLKEDLGGTQPKVSIVDGAGRIWNVKFGFEVKPESFTWRIPSAVGYFMEANYYVASGRIERLGAMKRRTPSLQPDGNFKDARFQIRDPKLKYLSKPTWTWRSNPFAGTKELKGLAIMVMLASNWDNKDGTAGPGEANTGLFERRGPNRRKELIYTFTDWGSGMGAWGDKTGQTDWNCQDYTRQSKEFIKGVNGGEVVFGYEGHMKDGFQTGIRASDVGWLMKYLGQVSDEQIRAGLHASGAVADEESCFTAAIRSRIEALRAVTK